MLTKRNNSSNNISKVDHVSENLNYSNDVNLKMTSGDLQTNNIEYLFNKQSYVLSSQPTNCEYSQNLLENVQRNSFISRPPGEQSPTFSNSEHVWDEIEGMNWSNGTNMLNDRDQLLIQYTDKLLTNHEECADNNKLSQANLTVKKQQSNNLSVNNEKLFDVHPWIKKIGGFNQEEILNPWYRDYTKQEPDQNMIKQRFHHTLITSEHNQTLQQNKVKSNGRNKYRLILHTPFATKTTISYGLIVYAKDTGRWAIVQRKHSVEFLLFIRGLYRITHLPLLLSCITQNEANVIIDCLNTYSFIKLYTDLALDKEGLNYALIRIMESRELVLQILSKLDLSHNELKWTWPKGRMLYTPITEEKETPLSCAKREFMEEVEFILPSPLFVSDTYVSENVYTLTGRNIESRYWIYIIENEISMPAVNNHPEVSDRKWVNHIDCAKLINHTNLFKEIIHIILQMSN